MTNYTPSATLLNNRIILVTGAGDGIGRAAAKSFAAHGATVILLGRTVRKLETLYDEIEKNGGPKPAICPMNLETATPKDYETLVNMLEKEFGRLDGLLHNAAVLGTLTPIEHYNVNTWYQVMQVNLHASFLLTQACLKLLKKSDDASILFTSSDVGRQGRAYWGAYAVSNFAVEGLMQVLAAELDTNTSIRVNSIDPGPTRTAMRATAYPGEDPSTLPPPEDILSAYLYLMGPDSKGVNGQAMNGKWKMENGK
jgi:NAD(P)-dependent dehydrogenase (short-subunit alcohol dehydrogenase family)